MSRAGHEVSSRHTICTSSRWRIRVEFHGPSCRALEMSSRHQPLFIPPGIRHPTGRLLGMRIGCTTRSARRPRAADGRQSSAPGFGALQFVQTMLARSHCCHVVTATRALDEHLDPTECRSPGKEYQALAGWGREMPEMMSFVCGVSSASQLSCLRDCVTEDSLPCAGRTRRLMKLSIQAV